MNKPKITIQENKNGVSIWVNGRWVLDASLFKEDMEFNIDSERMKEKKRKYDGQRRFKYDKRFI